LDVVGDINLTGNLNINGIPLTSGSSIISSNIPAQLITSTSNIISSKITNSGSFTENIINCGTVNTKLSYVTTSYVAQISSSVNGYIPLLYSSNILNSSNITSPYATVTTLHYEYN
jgi:hypothetical protein